MGRRALGVRVAPLRGHRQPVPLNDASRSALGWTGLRGSMRPDSGAGISFLFAMFARVFGDVRMRTSGLYADTRRGTFSVIAGLDPAMTAER